MREIGYEIKPFSSYVSLISDVTADNVLFPRWLVEVKSESSGQSVRVFYDGTMINTFFRLWRNRIWDKTVFFLSVPYIRGFNR